MKKYSMVSHAADSDNFNGPGYAEGGGR